MRSIGLLLFAFAAGVSTVSAEPPPNILLIYVDDLGYGDLASYGHHTVKTPVLDELARQGMRLTSYYAPAPLCSPSRAGLLTGRTPKRTGVETWIPAGADVELGTNEISLATLLKARGYQTFLSGKWHLNGGPGKTGHLQPDDHGFDHWLALHGWPVPNQRDPVNFYRDGTALGKIEGFTGEIVVDQAISWLESRDTDSPFFLYLAMIEVHSLIASPDEYNRRYSDFTRGVPEPFENTLSADLPPPTNLEARGPGEYWANVSYMDAQIGRMLDHLETSGLAEQTLVVFTSDNGPVTPDWRHWWEVNLYGDTGGLRGRKADLYEGGIRVPAIVRWPGRVPAGSVSDLPVYGLDWLPTLATLAGADTPADRTIDGEDVSALLLGESFARDKPLYWEFPDDNGYRYALRQGDWKILADESLETVHLYDLGTDRFEMQDQAHHRPEILAELLAELRSIRDSVANDPLRAARARSTPTSSRVAW